MAHGYNFENWLDWPQCEDNWPVTFDKVHIFLSEVTEKWPFSHFFNESLLSLQLMEKYFSGCLSIRFRDFRNVSN